jgi:hypothetical protein
MLQVAQRNATEGSQATCRGRARQLEHGGLCDHYKAAVDMNLVRIFLWWRGRWVGGSGVGNSMEGTGRGTRSAVKVWELKCAWGWMTSMNTVPGELRHDDRH